MVVMSLVISNYIIKALSPSLGSDFFVFASFSLPVGWHPL